MHLVKSFSTVKSYIGIPYREAKRIVNESLKLEQRFGSGDAFSDYVTSMLATWFVHTDLYYWWDRKRQIWELLQSWKQEMEEEKYEYMLESDCDDFARGFSSHTALKFGINSALRVWGTVEVDGSLFGHAWNVVLMLFRVDSTTVSAAPVYVEPQIPVAGLPDQNGEWTVYLDEKRATYRPYAVLG